MQWYVSFILGILSGIITSIIATIILNAFSGLRKIIPPKMRKSFDCEFKNQDKATKSILRDAENSSFMYVFAMKGGSFCQNRITPESPNKLGQILENKNLEQKYLITSLKNPYLKIRKDELAGKGGIALDTGVKASHLVLTDAAKDSNSKISFRQHNEVVRFRLIIFEHAMYISFQPKDQPGKTSPMQRYLEGSSGYVALRAFFEEKWEEYKESDSKSISNSAQQELI